MAEAGIALQELLADNELGAEKWRVYFEKNRTALDVPCGIYNSGSVRGLVRHLFAVELRHSQRLLGEEVTPYESIPTDSFEGLFQVHKKAVRNLRRFLTNGDPAALQEEIAIQTVSAKTLHASRRKLFAHVMLHSIRHWAQLATLVGFLGAEQPGFCLSGG